MASPALPREVLNFAIAYCSDLRNCDIFPRFQTILYHKEVQMHGPDAPGVSSIYWALYVYNVDVLRWACEVYKREKAWELLTGQNINLREFYRIKSCDINMSPVMMAVELGRLDMLKILIDHNANDEQDGKWNLLIVNMYKVPGLRKSWESCVYVPAALSPASSFMVQNRVTPAMVPMGCPHSTKQ
ncbi:hypothetical protein B0H63DRAFT_443191 [Podospora didyma]|uniref:Ankyrin repeat protein n=1 Tax=Podospora didyma TaxID=330526 RepID=A0AAE0P462_9PEZI|nr:hypothetical protein B0H63DRAFT_443191 [Podospora didyma]